MSGRAHPFQGEELRGAIRRQQLAQCSEQAAKLIEQECGPRIVKKGTILIKSGARSWDVFLILSGSFDVFVHTQRVNTRNAGEHIGEMAILCGGRRTATVVAREDSVVCRIKGKTFDSIASKCPMIWKNVARVLAARLDQRRTLIREPNERPYIFIASSSENKDVAAALEKTLENPEWDVKPWDAPEVFEPSGTTIQTLIGATLKADFAVVIFGAEDSLFSRKAVFKALETTWFLKPDCLLVLLDCRAPSSSGPRTRTSKWRQTSPA
jgi:CRP/FNR family cyclic AMP-dependent transcriptional regulator